MFKSIERGGKELIADRIWEYIVVDSDFEENVMANNLLDGIIKVYSNRKLNVAKNIIRFMKYFFTIYPNSDIDFREWVLRAAPQYLEEFDKYLMLV